MRYAYLALLVDWLGRTLVLNDPSFSRSSANHSYTTQEHKSQSTTSQPLPHTSVLVYQTTPSHARLLSPTGRLLRRPNILAMSQARHDMALVLWSQPNPTT